MINRDLYFRDPTTFELLNNGVSKVSEIGHDERQIKTLRFELETFVCDGEYARGLERILKAYLDGLDREEQKAVWVSGFFGSGKSHLVKVLRYLWEDYRFSDGATARSLVKLPAEITDLLKELSTRSQPLGGLRAAAGTLGAGAMDNVRLAFIQLVLRAAGLPENLSQAKFILWLRESGLEAKVELAKAIVTRYWDAEAAERAAMEFDRVFKERKLPADMPEIIVPRNELKDGKIWIIKLLVLGGFAKTNGEARRLVAQGGVNLNDETFKDADAEVNVTPGTIIKVGKRRFARISVVD